MKKAMAARVAAQASADSARRLNADQTTKDSTDNTPMDTAPAAAAPPVAAPETSTANTPTVSLSSNLSASDSNSHPRAAWEHVDEILQSLKTNFPLLILSLETMVDQVQHKFKPTPEEEVYRSICMLLSDAIQVRWKMTSLFDCVINNI